MIREILALGLSKHKERIGVKTVLCFGLKITGTDRPVNLQKILRGRLRETAMFRPN